MRPLPTAGRRLRGLVTALALLGPPASAPAEETLARRIVGAVASAAEENARRPAPDDPKAPEGSPRRAGGDALADLLVRAAAGAARGELERGARGVDCARAFLLALGVALDHSGFLQEHPLLKAAVGKVESREERRARARRIAAATLRGRSDSLQHFAVAAAILGSAGEPLAWVASLEKEVLDAVKKDQGGGGGFSFADLAADRAGIEFAKRLLAASGTGDGLREALDRIERGFRGADFVPDLALYERSPEEGLGWKEFQARFGSLTDSRFVPRVRALTEDVLRCPGFR